VVGTSDKAAPPYPAVAWSPAGGLSFLTSLAGGNGSAIGVNDAGVIVGSANDAIFNNRAVRWDSTIASPTTLGELGGGVISEAWDINASGQIVGRSDPGNPWTPVIWNGGAPVALGLLGGGTTGHAKSINDAGNPVGWTDAAGRTQRAVIWPGAGAVSALLELAGATVSVAEDINASGVIVGNCDTTGGVVHAVKWASAGATPTILQDIPGIVSANATAINDAGIAVGVGYDGVTSYPLAWAADGSLTVLPLLAGGTTALCLDINDANQIVGTGDTVGGINDAILWNPYVNLPGYAHVGLP